MTETTRIIVLPPPPRPQPQFSYDYANQMNRWLTALQEQLQGVYYLRGGGLWLSPDSLPVSGYGLKPGEVFANDGILTIAREGDVWAGGVGVEASVTSVTVS